MNLVSAETFYRAPFEAKAWREDGQFANIRTGHFGVVDGVSAAYSPSNPPMKYDGGAHTGGQAVASLVVAQAAMVKDPALDIRSFAANANNSIRSLHYSYGKTPSKDDVGAAAFSLCHLDGEGIEFLLGADCAAFLMSDDGPRFENAFDETATATEERDERMFAEHLAREGSIGRAWDAYYPQFLEKKLTFANKRMGNGGYAILNGDCAVENCWTYFKVPLSSNPRSVLLMTDGMLPSSWTAPSRRGELAKKLAGLAGLPPQAILAWRDEEAARAKESLHVSGWPEASMVKLVFD